MSERTPYRPANKKSIREVVEVARLPGGDQRTHHVYATVPESMAARIKAATGLDVSGYYHVLDYDAVRHVMHRHGPAGVADHSIGEADFDLLPTVATDADDVTHGHEPDSIVYRKRVGRHDLVAVQTVRSRKYRLLAIKTLYKIEGR